MQTETASKPDLDADSPDSNTHASSGKETSDVRPKSRGKIDASQNDNAADQPPPPKSDKPRPHVCGTCARSFARLEHLKRHERSHTKEKPFECPECSRCFARRDLLLRHQQKLHQSNPTAAQQQRSARRESASSTVTGARVRKNSVANGNVGGSGGQGGGLSRPRANTISHIDLSTLGLLDGSHPGFNRLNTLGMNGHSMNMGGMPGSLNFDYRGMSTSLGHHGHIHGLPKLDTHSINNMDTMGALRTAPPNASFGGFDIDQLFSPGTTINPAQLHFGGPAPATLQELPPLEPFTVHAAIDPGAQVDDFGWMRNWNMQMTQDSNENAIDESSPSRMSSGDSPGDFSESMNNSNVGLPIQHGFQWPQLDSQAQRTLSNGPFQLGTLGSGLPNLDHHPDTISPNTLHDPTPTGENYFQNAMAQQHQQLRQQPQHDIFQGQNQNMFAAPMSTLSSDSPSMSSSSMNGSARPSSVTSMSTDSITDATRQALLMSLAQPSVFGYNHRKYSQPTISSPLSPGGPSRSPLRGPNLPRTADIRRYVEAFIKYAHPHMPVTHVPTLSFDAIELASGAKNAASNAALGNNGLNGGAGCLVLGMAAIGALYEYDHPTSKELFEAAKKMISIYLEERRKADMSAAVNGSNNRTEHETPLWLVQAMLLNVIYGHQCGDKTAADIASNHCAALVSLARAANLAQSPSGVPPGSENGTDPREGPTDVEMSDGIAPGDSVSRHQSQENDLQTQWINWKTVEERKRTLFAIFIISSLLTTAYNQTPTIMNSEIMLDLPCDEELWAAESAQEWQNRGGLAAVEARSLSFASALGTLLTAKKALNKRRSSKSHGNGNGINLHGASQGDEFIDSGLRPSTFGCLVLINALHNYIWETRSRHHGRQWTPQETEAMVAHIEPALNAWQVAWKSNPHHKLERPNPFGLGPLAADSIPLLDLAFVRLFVNLGRAKEAFWSRDFDLMAEELARGSEIVQHADATPHETDERKNSAGANGAASHSPESGHQRRASQAPPISPASSRRERHLRKAAFYAADSLSIACGYNLTYTDPTAHELPVQSAMCFFDCGQVLAEWACTVQERVGGYVGVLGRNQIDYAAVPAIMLLESEDVELLRKIENICESFETKRFQQESLFAMEAQHMNLPMTGDGMSNKNLTNCGYGSKILRITGMMLEKAIVWPVSHVMSKALEIQANHMDQRAEASNPF